MKHTSLALLLLLFLSGLILGQNYPSFPIGQYWQFPDARSLSLGGAGSVSMATPGAMQYNPAALTQIGHTAVASVSMNTRKLEERRSYPLYDRFESIVARGTYAINNNWYLRPQGAVALQIPLEAVPGLTIALGSFTEIDQQYEYQEEVRENIFGDPLIAYNRIEFDGILQRYGAAVALPMPNLPDLSVGIQASVLDGSLDYKKEVDFIREERTDILTDVNRTLDNTPFLLSFGAIFRATERISGGFDVALPYSVDYTAMSSDGNSLTETIEYPLKLNAGFEYRSQQELRAKLNVDVGYEFWSSVDYSSQIEGVVSTSEEFSDVFVVKAGIEHIFYNQIPFRVGMQYRNSYRNRGNTQTLLSAGTGFFGENWQVDAAGGFSKLSYKWQDLFDDQLFLNNPNFQERVDMDDVDETYFFARITLSYFLDFGNEK